MAAQLILCPINFLQNPQNELISSLASSGYSLSTVIVKID